MAIKSVFGNYKASFPKLMINTPGTTVILAVREVDGRIGGTVVGAIHDKNRIGEYRDTWDATGFGDYHGEVCLSNG